MIPGRTQRRNNAAPGLAGTRKRRQTPPLFFYPGPDALWALFSDPGYRAAYHHRTAACARQKVMLAG